MSGHSHHDHSHVLDGARHALHIALILNFIMFMVELWQGLAGDSISLIADSMDFLSDSFSYVITLYVLERSLRARAHASLLKASLMLLLAAGALFQGAHNIIHGELPHFATMGWVGFLALIVNVVSALLLYRTRTRDSNMESVWLCSRNDAIANIAIIAAAFFVYLTNTLWPDIIVALIITWLEGSSALKIIARAKKELRHGH